MKAVSRTNWVCKSLGLSDKKRGLDLGTSEAGLWISGGLARRESSRRGIEMQRADSSGRRNATTFAFETVGFASGTADQFSCDTTKIRNPENCD